MTERLRRAAFFMPALSPLLFHRRRNLRQLP
jgi:hypothetical protein